MLMSMLPEYDNAMPLQLSSDLSYYFYRGSEDSYSYDSVKRQVCGLIAFMPDIYLTVLYRFVCATPHGL